MKYQTSNIIYLFNTDYCYDLISEKIKKNWTNLYGGFLNPRCLSLVIAAPAITAAISNATEIGSESLIPKGNFSAINIYI